MSCVYNTTIDYSSAGGCQTNIILSINSKPTNTEPTFLLNWLFSFLRLLSLHFLYSYLCLLISAFFSLSFSWGRTLVMFVCSCVVYLSCDHASSPHSSQTPINPMAISEYSLVLSDICVQYFLFPYGKSDVRRATTKGQTFKDNHNKIWCEQ